MVDLWIYSLAKYFYLKFIQIAFIIKNKAKHKGLEW